MSRSKRRSDNTAPALFPFLAVLLCTIGALVLILVITVTNSHASARRDAETALSEVKDTSDIVEVVSEELTAQREAMKNQIDRRRIELANIEDHISRLTKNLEQLADRIDRIESESTQTDLSKAEKAERLSELKKEIDKRKIELLDEIEKQKKRKPAFAVIPYGGANGTSRRPVYLECTKDGVVVQPEGLLISLNDLKPPLGPGNPLDAALRVLRLAYQQRDTTFGINQPPYPLLLIRPDGIQSYALAREAMSGWDDQFGYELINSDMDLKFPSGIPGLDKQLIETISVAKKRQQAFVRAMPRSYSEEQEDSWDAIDASNASIDPGYNSQTARDGSGLHGESGSNENGFSESSSNENWQMVQGIANSQVVGAIQRNGQEQSSAFGQTGRMQAFPSGKNEQPVSDPSVGINGQFSVLASDANAMQRGSRNQTNSQANVQGSGVPDTQAAGLSDERISENNTGADPSRSGSDTGNASNSGPNATGPNATGPNATGPNATGPNATGQPSNASDGTGTSSSSNASSGGTQSPSGANAFSSGTANGNKTSGMQSTTGSVEPTQPDASPNVSLNVSQNTTSESKQPPKAKHVNPDGDLKPISVSAGRGWAASRAEGKATPVSRPINVIALKDRWLMRSDSDPLAFEASITMEEGPQQAGNQLASAIRKRVDSWGLSLPGGFWAPTLTIEAASDSQQSVARLEKLLEGSGVEIKVVPLQLPNRR